MADSYMPCPECRWEPPIERDARPGIAVRFPGTTHYGDCPTVQIMSREEQVELRDRLVEMDRVRRRGAAEAANFWIG